MNTRRAKLCKTCMRPATKNIRGKLHLCDMVTLSDGHVVHTSRVEIGGDLHDRIGKDFKVVSRNITPEMREQMRKGKL